ncbi:NUDIX domain-containing protein [Leptospira sp. GIMC2001]|uniref:NUDIX domain-containing protein n=1 Tax=Leptospira sp. GIMC2001 TaxID=1513297 RepID=UPI00234B31E3|nr:NUDIX domain-containing protein [Leptospira sp. GIMC2001]WCL51289.1 NUDIX domain-containing protein [Leptospira sp. GIMC2001]
MNKPFRPNVGMVVFNSQGLVLAGERLKFIGSWQFPQGGIDDGEDPKNAANRELYEEVGIRVDTNFDYQSKVEQQSNSSKIIHISKSLLNERSPELMSHAILVYEFPIWISYDFPSDLKLKGKMKKYRGQTQKWFLYFWDHPESDCSLDHHEKEFEEVRFLSWDKVVESIVPFKKEIYVSLEKEFVPIIEDFLLQYNKS